MRHAKAEPGDRDFERPLARRGRNDAEAIGDWLIANAIVPDLVAVSPSRRTVETWELAAARLDRPTRPFLDDRVYENRLARLVELIGETAPSVSTLAIVGHNPSLQELAGSLGGEEVGGFRTATVALFDVAGEWSGLDRGTATLVDIATCRA